MRELTPGHEDYWFEAYGRVAKTGKAVRFENRDKQLDRWFDVYAFPVDHGHHNRVGVLFRDITQRKQASEAVHAREARFRDFADNAPAMLWVTESDGSCSFLSRGWYEFTGQTESNGSGFGWLEAVHPEDREAARDKFLAANSRCEPFALEHRLRQADGVYRWVVDTGRPRMGLAGECLGYIGVVFDIDDRKRAEAELHASREALRAILDTVPQRVFWKDLSLTYLGCNQPFAREMGFDSPADVVGKTDDQATWAAAADDYRADDRRVIDTATPKLDFEEVLPRSDGSQQWVRTSKVPLRGPDGRVAGVLGTYEDVTERHRLEERLREQERLLRETAELSHVGGWSFDPITLQGDWTAETARIHGLDSADDASVADGLLRFPPEDRARIEAAVKAACEHGTPYDLELDFTAADGVKKRVRAICKPVMDGGKVVRVRGSLQDVTERYQLEERLRQAQKMEAIGILAGGVAHDFNNTMMIISGYCDGLLASLDPSSKVAESVREIRAAGERAAGLTHQLLAFSRKDVLVPRVLDLNEIVRQSEVMLTQIIGEDVQLSTVLDPDLWPVEADPSQASQLVINLAVNARDAMPMGGQLTVKTANAVFDEPHTAAGYNAPPGRYVRLTVTDTGTGIDAATQARIFEPFFTTKEVGKGTGLGLAVVHGFVKQSGGHITVDSELGRGTTFHIYLPVAVGSPIRESVRAQTISPRGSETILLVEDEVPLRRLISRCLRECGFTVLEASNGGEGFRVAAQYPGEIQMLLSDVVMPELNGRILAEKLVASRPAIKVLLMSGYTDDKVARHGGFGPDVDFVQKPLNPVALAAKIREILDRKLESD